MNKPNPNGSNQTTSDPRESVMWEIYVKNLAKGIDNAYSAAVEAGYGKASAKNITLRGWFKERENDLRRKEMLSKAERNLAKVLDTNYETEEGIKSDVMRIVTDTSKFVSQTLGKKHYSEKTEVEHTGTITLAGLAQRALERKSKDTDINPIS